MHPLLLILFTFGIASGLDEVEAPQLDCFTPALVDPAKAGLGGAMVGGALGVIEGRFITYMCDIVPQDGFAFVLGTAVSGISAFALRANITVPEASKKLEQLQRDLIYVANHHNTLGEIISKNQRALEFARFLLQPSQSHDFSLKDNQKLAKLDILIAQGCNSANKCYKYYSRYNIDGQGIGSYNKKIIEDFIEQIKKSQLPNNLKTIHKACKSRVQEKIYSAAKIQEYRKKLDTSDNHIDILSYINLLESQCMRLSDYNKIKHDVRLNNIIPTFSPYVIPKKVILSLLNNKLRLQTLESLEVESPMTVSALESVQEKYKEDSCRIDLWQKLISCDNSEDNIETIVSTLFNDYSQNLDSRFNDHNNKLIGKQNNLNHWIPLAHDPNNGEDVLDTLQEKGHLWRINLSTTNIKGE